MFLVTGTVTQYGCFKELNRGVLSSKAPLKPKVPATAQNFKKA
jgi:hypothetical protein